MAANNRPDFPTMDQVEKANHEQLAWWYGRYTRTQENHGPNGRALQETRRNDAGAIRQNRTWWCLVFRRVDSLLNFPRVLNAKVLLCGLQRFVRQ